MIPIVPFNPHRTPESGLPMTRFKCGRCGHSWLQPLRFDSGPLTCPVCWYYHRFGAYADFDQSRGNETAP
jgi:hypothetical protein